MNKPPMGLLALGLLLIDTAAADFKLNGVECDEKYCSTHEYCSPYDKHCKPCSSICDSPGEIVSAECVSDCQEYLHDKRYVLLEQYKEEVGRLWILVVISMAMALLSLLSIVYAFVHRFARWDKIRAAVGRTFTGSKRIERTENGNNNDNRRKDAEDAELGAASRHNGLKLTMPTISASVAPSRHAEPSSASRNENGSGSGIDNVTPNTTSTTLSRRHPSEDTTLDYAYDNPAMTPSPEAVQLRPKRESSF
ncbi:unnamed protein product [Xylocopa violacea]|uniref:Protein grindelwald n=1 Tax=Xylocopa violacea TaxID=135666 RepID=A0ABP1PIW8_XYLVO